MRSREEILNRIYKACFRFPGLEEDFFDNWKWVAETIKGGDKDRVTIEVLYCVDLWLDTFPFLTF